MLNKFVIFRDDKKPDRNGNKFVLDNIEVPSEVPVLLNFKAQVGIAKLNRVGDEIIAEFKLIDSFKGYYPSISIRALKTHKEGDITVIDKARLIYVAIHTNPNVDDTVLPLDQVEVIL